MKSKTTVAPISPLDAFLERAARQTGNPRLRAWLLALRQGEPAGGSDERQRSAEQVSSAEFTGTK